MWGLFLFLPVATAAAAAIPTGPDKEIARLKVRKKNIKIIFYQYCVYCGLVLLPFHFDYKNNF